MACPSGAMSPPNRSLVPITVGTALWTCLPSLGLWCDSPTNVLGLSFQSSCTRSSKHEEEHSSPNLNLAVSLHTYTFPREMANSGREGPRGTGAGGWGLAPPGMQPWECGRICNSFKRNWKSRSLSEISQVLKHWPDFSNLAMPTKQDSVPENQPWERQLAASPQQTKFKSSKQEKPSVGPRMDARTGRDPQEARVPWRGTHFIPW